MFMGASMRSEMCVPSQRRQSAQSKIWRREGTARLSYLESVRPPGEPNEFVFVLNCRSTERPRAC